MRFTIYGAAYDPIVIEGDISRFDRSTGRFVFSDGEMLEVICNGRWPLGMWI